MVQPSRLQIRARRPQHNLSTAAYCPEYSQSMTRTNDGHRTSSRPGNSDAQHPVTGVIVVDHGSRRDESNRMLLAAVGSFRAATDYSIVEPAHMELVPPTIADAFDRCVDCGAQEVIVFPYLLLPGRHWRDDIPRLTAQAASRHPSVRFLVCAPFGVHPLMAEIMQQRIDHCIRHSRGHAERCDACRDGEGCSLRVAHRE